MLEMAGKWIMTLTVIETFHQGRECTERKEFTAGKMNGNAIQLGMVKAALIKIKLTAVHAEVVFNCLKNVCNLGLHNNRVLFEIIPAQVLSMKNFLKLLLLRMSDEI